MTKSNIRKGTHQKVDGPVRGFVMGCAGLCGFLAAGSVALGIFTENMPVQQGFTMGAFFGIPALVLWGIGSLIPQKNRIEF